MCAKSYGNRTIDFIVMIKKKTISDENFRISLRQSWKIIVGTPDAICYNYPHA